MGSLRSFLMAQSPVLLEVISTRGDYISNQNGSLEPTLGEVVIFEFSGNNHLHTQGFHQKKCIPGTTSLDEIPQTSPIVFPNPFSETCTVKSPGLIELVSVFDITGKLIFEEFVQDQSFTLDGRTLARGLYMIKLHTHNQESSKIIKISKI